MDNPDLNNQFKHGVSSSVDPLSLPKVAEQLHSELFGESPYKWHDNNIPLILSALESVEAPLRARIRQLEEENHRLREGSTVPVREPEATPHEWASTPENPNTCTICGDGPWGIHRFQVPPPEMTVVEPWKRVKVGHGTYFQCPRCGVARITEWCPPPLQDAIVGLQASARGWPQWRAKIRPRRRCQSGGAMSVEQARVVSLHWEDTDVASQEATLEVEHPNGDRQLFVIPILRMTDRLKGEMKPKEKVR